MMKNAAADTTAYIQKHPPAPSADEIGGNDSVTV
jgi:hypothetical protein